ncbi:MAG: ATP synthase F1 subunit epsilon [bacterium]|nr:ATP synthase F1 subunit epsilon [bacterium]
MALFSLKIIASDHIFYDGKASLLVIPAMDGEKGIMANHEEMVIAVVTGELRFTKEDGTKETAAVGNGVVQIAYNRVTVLVDTAERPEEIDERRAREALERAEEQLRQKNSIQQYKVAQASMARALSRLKEKQKYEIH